MEVAFLKCTPFRAPIPNPTTNAVGVANPNAQGHAIIRTETNILIENSNDSPDAEQFCSECGGKNSSSAKFCRECGINLI